MNILYIAHERRSAEAAASALHRFSQNVTLTWAQSASTALGWLRDHGNAHAIIIDAEAHDARGAVFLDQVRRLGVATPMAVIASEHLERLLGALATNLNDAETSRRRLVDEQAKDRAALARTSKICTALQERMLELEAALHAADARDVAHKSAREALEQRLAEAETASRDSSLEQTALQSRLQELEAAVRSADERHAADVAATDRLTAREAALNAAVTEGLAARAALEKQLKEQATERSLLSERLAAAATARQRADARHAMQVASLTGDVADLKSRHDSAVAEKTAAERRFRDTSAALEEARARIADLTATSDRLASRESELEAALNDATTDRVSVEQQLTDVVTSHQQTRERWEFERAQADAEHAHKVESLASRLADLQAQHDEALEEIASVAQQLTDAVSAHEDAQQESQALLTAAAERLARREEDLGTTLAAEIDARIVVENRLSDADRARERADAEHALAVEAFDTRLADLQAQHDRALEQIASVERELTDALSAHEHDRQESQSQLKAAAEQLARREEELGTALAQEIDARLAVENSLTEAEAVHQQTQQQAAADLAFAAARHAALENRLNEEVATRTALENRLSEADRARQQAESTHAQAIESLTTQLADLQTQHDRALDQIASVERQLADAASAHEHAQQESQSQLAAAAEQLARREEELVTALTEEIDTRLSLENRLTNADRARQRAETDHAHAVESLTTQLADLQTQYDRALEQSASVERQLTDAVSAHEHAQQLSEANLEAAAEREANLEDRLAQAATAYATLEDRLAAAENDRQDADERYASELATLRQRLTDLQGQHDAALTAHGRDIARLQEDGRGLRRQLNAMRMHASSLRQETERAGRLQMQLVETQKDIRRQFERAPYGLFECAPDGSITRVNNVLARLLGYRGSVDLPREDFVATVFESAADLHYLLERAKPTENVQPIETTLKTRDHRRLFVRLHALTSSGSVLIAVEDLTKLSTLEQRVREAQRMEAVGRVASEVAVTCDTLLRDVTRGGQRWLSGFASDPSQRQQGEQLLGDVTRAAGLLRQFAVYGQTQITNVEPVSMQRVLLDMKPVIERILGDDVELTLPKTTQAFEVDVDAARVERILVNAANYARERMPHGGRVRIQLATTVVDQQFLARHPKVRAGSHVLVTISEMQGASRPTLPIEWPAADRPERPVEPAPMEKPGIDLGPLMALISGLGGHLWMSVEPAGNMTLQIRLPQRTQDIVMEPTAPGAPASRGRPLGKWFRH